MWQVRAPEDPALAHLHLLTGAAPPVPLLAPRAVTPVHPGREQNQPTDPDLQPQPSETPPHRSSQSGDALNAPP